MDTTDITRYQDIIVAAVTTVGLKVLGALVFWVIGRWLISLVLSMIRRTLERQKVDPTVLRYLSSVVSVTLNVFLVIGILGYFGVQTTTFAALVAGIGIAIGAAWAGLLANFAAGAFMITLRPFKVGDFVTVAGVTGTVTEIGLFATTLNTPDNVSTVIGNNKIFGDNIQNYVANPFRRVDLKCQLSGATDHRAAIALLREKITALPNVLAEPAVEIDILEFNLVGPVLAVRPYCHNDHYWQVYFETNKVLREALAEAGFPAPMPAQNVVVTQSA